MDRYRAIANKARSERGASLSMALLVFLVCTVVASIVLSAATAVSGRQSQLEDMEKSYYNVTSAARVFWDEMSNGGNGLTVKIERGCNAEKNAGGDWDGWYLVIDDSLGTGTGKDIINSSNGATLFQIASYDLVMNRNGSQKFDDDRKTDEETVAASFDSGSSEPTPKPASNATASYSPFNFTAKRESTNLNTVKVTVTRNDDQTFEFEFREEGDSSYSCTLTALVWAEGGNISRNNDTNRLEGTTTVMWKPITMTVGV